MHNNTVCSIVAWRTPAIEIRMSGQTPSTVAKALGDRDTFTWNGNFMEKYIWRTQQFTLTFKWFYG